MSRIRVVRDGIYGWGDNDPAPAHPFRRWFEGIAAAPVGHMAVSSTSPCTPTPSEQRRQRKAFSIHPEDRLG